MILLSFSLSSVAGNAIIDQAAAEYQFAFNEADFFIKNKLILADYDGYLPMYIFENYFAAQSYVNYQAKLIDLFNESSLSIGNNSFILGICLACLKKLTGSENNKMALGILPGVVGLLVLQNRQIGKVPYFAMLEYRDNLFTSIGSLSIRVLKGLSVAAISYMGVNYIFDRIDGLKKIKQNNKQVERQDQA